MPPDFRAAPAPVISERQAVMLSGRWRKQVRSQIETRGLDPSTELAKLMDLAGEEHRRALYAVLTGFRSYSPEELSAHWLEGDRYRPELWLEQWQASAASGGTGTALAERGASTTADTAPTTTA